jgi:hypothetical protein
MDSIQIKNGAATNMVGPKAVDVFRLAALVSGLRLELKCPGMKMSRHLSALAAAKTITGLRTNDRAKHLARAEIMLEQAKTEVVYVDEEDA